MWFANQWSTCSSKCKAANGIKTRTVMCGVMKVIPPPASDNSTSANETEASGDDSVVEGTGGNRKKRQTDGSGDEGDSSSANEKKTEEKTITIIEDSECDESTKYVVYKIRFLLIGLC
jgi:hypothetical protein